MAVSGSQWHSVVASGVDGIWCWQYTMCQNSPLGAKLVPAYQTSMEEGEGEQHAPHLLPLVAAVECSLSKLCVRTPHVCFERAWRHIDDFDGRFTRARRNVPVEWVCE